MRIVKIVLITFVILAVIAFFGSAALIGMSGGHV